jgi:hypothetical protein
VVRGREALLGREPWFGTLYANPKAALAGETDLLAAMDEAGVETAVACGFPWSDPGRCRAENDVLAEASRRGGGRVACSPASPRSTARGGSGGRAGVRPRGLRPGRVERDGQGFDLADPAALAPVALACIEADRPCCSMRPNRSGHAYPGKGTATPEKLLAFVAAFPGAEGGARPLGGRAALSTS